MSQNQGNKGINTTSKVNKQYSMQNIGTNNMKK